MFSKVTIVLCLIFFASSAPRPQYVVGGGGVGAAIGAAIGAGIGAGLSTGLRTGIGMSGYGVGVGVGYPVVGTGFQGQLIGNPVIPQPAIVSEPAIVS